MFFFFAAGAPLLVAVIVLSKLFRFLTSHSIRDLRGPKPNSWLIGSLGEFLRPPEAGEPDLAWTKEFGSTMTIKGVMGQDILFTGDPKALQYILNTSGYNFPKPQSGRELAALTTGHGMAWAEGSQHARHRKVMNPAFSFGALRRFLPLFRDTAQRMVVKLNEEISKSGQTSFVIDIMPWLSRTSLDAIGAAGFDYQFGAIDQGKENKLSKAYHNLFADAFFDQPDSMIVWEAVIGWVPHWMVSLFLSLPSLRLRRLKNYMKVALSVAKEVVDKQTAIYASGNDGSKDMMGILVRSNLAEDPQTKLSEHEVLSQLTTLFLAGHETTATAITWIVYELARHPEYQTLVRDEIKAAREQVAQRGDNELSIADLDSMKYLLSLMKETLRFHPVVASLTREAKRDDIIPLSMPITTKSGEIATSVPVPAKQRIILSFVAYHRLKSVWGDDADVWRPERFIDGTVKQGPNLGVIANIATFSSGVRSCIGWRFAVIEMQAILVEIVESFEFSPPSKNVEIIQGLAGIVVPIVKGSTDGCARLPVIVTPI